MNNSPDKPRRTLADALRAWTSMPEDFYAEPRVDDAPQERDWPDFADEPDRLEANVATELKDK